MTDAPRTPPLSPELAHYADLDARLVEAVRDLRILQSVSWPMRVQDEFVARDRRGNLQLPQVQYARADFSAVRVELEAIQAGADPTHPVGIYLHRTATSWSIATRLLECLGSNEVAEHSARLYGQPGDTLPGGGTSNLDAARHFIAIADELDRELAVAEIDDVIPAAVLQHDMQATLDAFFVQHKVQVELDPDLIAKAAAGATRIRLRSGADFNEYDRRQLLEHEAFVHSLSALNGREQPYLKSLARSSPRVTATQEGMATFAELITGAIDIGRMKRISLRILAIDIAQHGGDFIEVYQFFRDAGQTRIDSFTSTQRVFRGVPLTGGAAFTKDTVYLHGLLSVHTFFRWSLRHRKLRLCRLLFAGKMSLQDIFAFEPLFDSGFLAEPLYLPPWVQRANGLAGMLAFSLFANRIRLDDIAADDLVLGL